MSDKRPIIVIKKKGGHGGHHGGAWKVAYADFVTAMMALFIVLWLLSSSEKVKKAVAGYFQDPKSSQKEPGSGALGKDSVSVDKENAQKLKEQIEKAIKDQKEFAKLAKQIEITITPEGLRVELIEDKKGVFFQSGSSQLSDDGQQLLKMLAGQLKPLPNHLLLEGYTDSVPYSTDKAYTNWELSADRANSARRVLQQDGIGMQQISQVRGYADQLLRVKDDPTDPSNRRISVTVQWLDAQPEAKPIPPGSKVGEGKDAEVGKALTGAKDVELRPVGGKPPASPKDEAKAEGGAAKPESGKAEPGKGESSNGGSVPAPPKPAAGTAAPGKPSFMDRMKGMLPGHK